jgi:hypothetical protein
LDNLIERGLDPRVCRLFIVDGSKALAKAIRNTFGRHTGGRRNFCVGGHTVALEGRRDVWRFGTS